MDQEYTQRLANIQTHLERWLNDQTIANEVFSEAGKKVSGESLKALFEPVKDMLARGGKRWRPLLMTLVCETLGGGDSALSLSPLVEFSHNASLIHDDIEDDSDERRGKPVIHHIYGVDTAINSGSFFYFLSTCCIETCPFENKGQIYKLWAEYMRKLHLGQAMDISWHRNITFIPSIEEYYTMCGLKTGSLAGFSAELGAYAAGVTGQKARQMGEAAEKLGIGFQILDDVKNLTTGIPGKKQGDDVVEGKKSLPVLLYLNKYPEKKERVFFCFHAAKTDGASAPEVKELTEALSASGVLALAEEKGRSLIREACGLFNSPLIDGFISLIS